MPPPTKKQKRLAIPGPDKGNNLTSVPSCSNKDEIPNATLGRPSVDDTTKSTLASKRRSTRNVAKSQSSVSTRTFPSLADTLRQHPPDKLSAPTRSQAPRALSSFFGPASQLQPLTHRKLPNAVLPEPKHETEDVIEDDSPIEGGERLLTTQGKTLDGRGRLGEDRNNESVGSGRFKLAGNAVEQTVESPALAQNVPTTPWADRFGPSDLKELMVHKKKVTDVQTWLENVLQGLNRKRILILRGPSGAGKTATIRTIAKAMGLEMCEWRNPVGSDFLSEGYTSMAAQFEEFLDRSGRFGGLELTDSAGNVTTSAVSATTDQRNKIVLLEEFPHISAGSSALQSFRLNILEYLAVNMPCYGGMLPETLLGRVTPLVIVVTETHATISNAGHDSFTAHRLLGSDILSHPGVSVIDFNPMAATLLTKALNLVLQKEARRSGRRRIPGPAVLRRLGELGDVRSAIESLEFLCLRGDDHGDWTGRVASGGKNKASSSSVISKQERESMVLFTQRESNFGLFHAVGKVVYNKRDQIDASDEAVVQSPDHLIANARRGVSQVSVERLIDGIGTDQTTFIAALHENFVLSCEGSSFTSAINGCLEALSDTDILGSLRGGTVGSGGGCMGRSFRGAAWDWLRQDDICFELAVRGLLFSLPTNVNRHAHPVVGKSGRKNDSFKMFYPTSMRLDRQMDEVDSLVDGWIDRLRRGADVPASDRHHHHVSGLDNDEPATVRTNAHCTKAELVLERLPYLAKLKQKATASTWSNELEAITQFHGVDMFRSEMSDEEEANNAVERTTDSSAGVKIESSLRHVGISRLEKGTSASPPSIEAEVEKLYLSDDDIED